MFLLIQLSVDRHHTTRQSSGQFQGKRTWTRKKYTTSALKRSRNGSQIGLFGATVCTSIPQNRASGIACRVSQTQACSAEWEHQKQGVKIQETII